MRIALIGYGKMGKEIERLALERGWSVDLRIDIDTPPVMQIQRKKVDVVIHYAHAKTIVEDLTPWAEAHKANRRWNNRLARATAESRSTR